MIALTLHQYTMITIRKILALSFAIGISITSHLTHAQDKEPVKCLASEGSNELSGAKYNAYVRAFNALTGMFYGSTKGMPDLLDKFKGQRLESRSGSGVILYLNTSMFRNSLEGLTAGVKISDSGPYCELDTLARAIHPNFAQLFKTATALESYLKTKKFMDDDFQLGRELSQQMTAQWTQVIVDYDHLSDALDQAERIQRQRSIVALRKSGENLLAAVHESMYYSNGLLELVQSEGGLKNAETLKKSEQVLKLLEAAVNEIRELSGKDNQDHDLRRIAYIAQYMDTIIGQYREAKNAFFGGDDAKNRMVEAYNNAIRQFDRL